ncbi:MAG: hypothetical protein ABS36_08620 [Acidobacteria bacterium SCN 69-37]|nr:MAG: hypothetical protein ABS36_08620 [Acidobacteria bacterium SCN 69-37]
MTRSGSETRQRNVVRKVRLNDDEDAVIQAMMARTGLSLGALIRHALLNIEPPRAARRPTVEVEAAARLLAQLGKIGSNINQLTHYAHLGKFRSEEIDMALRDLAELRIACLKALGQEPDDPEDSYEGDEADDD